MGEVGTITDVFAQCDLDGNGKISRTELKRVFQTLSPGEWSDENVEHLLKGFDSNFDGSIDFREFTNWICSFEEGWKVSSMMDEAVSVAQAVMEDDQILFDAFNADESQQITKEDLSRVLGKLVPSVFSEAAVYRMLEFFDESDINKDGTLTVKEFIALVCCWKTDHELSHFKARDFSSDVQRIIEQEAAEARARELEAELRRRARSLKYSKGGRALLKFLEDNPFLARSSHELYQWVLECKEVIISGDEEKALDIVMRMALWAERTTTVLQAAFDRFNCNTDGEKDSTSLSPKEVQAMFEYLGFPSTDKDVEDMLAIMDKDNDGHLNFEEFVVYVGRTGGIYKLFEIRRKQLDRSRRDADRTADEEADREHLLEAGVLDDAQAFWRLVVPESELLVLTNLVACQKQAVRHIRQLAAANHSRAMPRLKERAKKLGFSDIELWTTLAFIREQAPIVIQIHLNKLMKFFEEDTHYRNQFETGTSHGTLSSSTRQGWERNLFGEAYNDASGFERPKYGVLNMMNDHRGVMRASQYGESYFILKDVRLRVTCSPKDSSGCDAQRLAVLDYFGHVLAEFNDNNLRQVINVANGKMASEDSSQLDHYKEIQIHGEVKLDSHIERIVVKNKHKSEEKRITAICKKHGWALSWMDDHKEDLVTQVAPAHKTRLDDEEWLSHVKLCHSMSLDLSELSGEAPSA